MIPVVAFFNTRAGAGTTTLVYNLAWRLADSGTRVLAADLDPQASLTSAFLDEDGLEEIWPVGQAVSRTIWGRREPLGLGAGSIVNVPSRTVASSLDLIPGDPALSSYEGELSEQWRSCLSGQEHAFRITSSFWRILQQAGLNSEAEIILVDLGPGLGAVNRTALLAADLIVFPLSPDLFSIQGLRSFGPAILRWRKEWKDRREKNPTPSLDLPGGDMTPAGYVLLEQAVRLDLPAAAHQWPARIPFEYAQSVLGRQSVLAGKNDPHRIALMKHYRSLIPMAQEARKPVFHLKPADGALGAHLTAANAANAEFGVLASELLSRLRNRIR